MPADTAFAKLPASWLRALGISVVLGALLYLVAMLIANPQETWSSIKGMGWQAWLWVLLLSLLNYGLRFLRWHGYLLRQGHRIPWRRHALVYVGGFALTTSPGKAGEALRSVYLASDKVPYSHSLAAFFTERLMDMLAMLVLGCLVLSSFGQYQYMFAVVAAAMAAGLLLLRNSRFLEFLHRRIETLRQQRLRALLDRLMGLLRASQGLLAWSPLLAGLLLGVLSWGAEGWGLYLIVKALGADVAWHMAVGIYALGILIGALSFIPGGLGSTEAVMAALLVLAGVDPAVSVAATLICRVATLWFAVLLGAVALAVLTAGKQGNKPAENSE